MQASQNTAQVFLGVNLKCNACHDSFVSHWKLKDAYALAGYFSPDPKLQLYRCDRALDQFVTPAFLYPELSRTPPSSSLDDRRATIAAIFTDARNGRLPRTLVNRVWQRLFGYGLVGNPDDMDVKPWNAALLDWLAADFVSHGYDIKHLLYTIMSSRAYQLPATGRHDEPRIRDYAFAGPEIRRLTAEQFADAIGSITGEWSVYPAADAPGGVYGRAWRSVPDNLSLALGRPIRDQVTTTRVSAATTLQGLELVNGSTLTMRLARGSQRMLGVLPQDPISLFNKPIAGRAVGVEAFDVDVSKASKLWLVVQENGSSAPERIEAVWADAELVGPAGTTRLASLTPVETAGGRTGSRPIVLNGSDAPVRDGVRVGIPVAGALRHRRPRLQPFPWHRRNRERRRRFHSPAADQVLHLRSGAGHGSSGPADRACRAAVGTQRHQRGGGGRSSLPIRARSPTVGRRTGTRRAGARGSGKTGDAVAVGACGSAVGAADDAGVSADLLRMS